MSNLLNMTEDEKKKILEKHKQETSKVNQKKEELKKGLQKPEKKEDKKTS